LLLILSLSDSVGRGSGQAFAAPKNDAVSILTFRPHSCPSF
jgi:hypothetical protein